jgi:hypothetical protein
MSAPFTSISTDRLPRLLDTAAAPTLLNVRIDQDFSADPRLIPGALRRSHLNIHDWSSGLTGQSVVVVCRSARGPLHDAFYRCCRDTTKECKTGQPARLGEA